VTLDLGAIERALSARLSDAAFAHSVRTGETAVDLAEAYGVDVELAHVAGLLHDWDREATADELVSSARATGDVHEVELAQPKLLHARTGAEGARQAFPDLPAEIYSAIEKHTVGAVQMSDLDKVVYLADMIEPARDWPGVDELRRCVGEVSLDQMFFIGYRMSLESLLRRRKRLHPDTVAVWNSLVSNNRHAKSRV
jgi:predicted HD superfamily hydrolase involved in NAD metabolism